MEGLDRRTLRLAGWQERVVAAPQFHENYVLTAPSPSTCESFAALDPDTLRTTMRCVLERAPTLVVIAHP